MSGKSMRSFWDERATENAPYFVDNRLEYLDPDLEEFWEHGRETLDWMLDAFGARIDPEDRVVEIGCGLGRMTHVLAERAAEVRALDVAPAMIEQARAHWPQLENVEWILGNGVDLEQIPDGSADVCISYVVFQHIPDPQITLGYVREIGRVLRSGGWAAFQVSNAPSIHRRRTGIEGLKIRLKGLLGRGPRAQADRHWLGSGVELADLRAAAADGGLTVADVSGEGELLCLVLVRKG